MRLEYKYIVPISEINNFRNQLLPFVELDPYSAKRKKKEYTVKSIYFDSKKLADYKAKVDGLYKRKKVRIRSYNDTTKDSMVFLEIKKRVGSHVYKNRSRISLNNLDSFLNEKDITLIDASENNLDAEKFLFYYLKGSLNPVTLVTYEREAFFAKHDRTLRITFDKNIRFKRANNYRILCSHNSSFFKQSAFFLLEIKFAEGFPIWLQEMLRQFNLARKSFSKYAASVDEIITLQSNRLNTNIPNWSMYA